MNYQTIETQVKPDGIGIVILNRPEKRNAISIRMRQEISPCLSEWRNNNGIGVLVITGVGKAFSAGFDLDEFKQQERFDELFESSTRYHRDLWNFPKPIIAAVNGPAMGGGLDLATLCDIRLCSESASFGHPEVKFGAPPLYTPLRWIIGDGLARDLCLTGRWIDAQEAHRIGLVSAVEEGELLLERAIQLARTVLEAPAATLQFVKGFFSCNVGKGFEESFQIEHDQAFREIILKHS
ncbi:MAG: enoyl-CoA hydratase/carnithine [Geobacteraceae bacterium]|nr:MAG: enoyl-CoA hydratase/carnithine [Geobacteraceae bacterium]